MTTMTIQLPDSETDIVSAISEIVKSVKGGHMVIDINDDGLTETEFASLKESLKEAALIKRGQLKPLSMKDLWDE